MGQVGVSIHDVGEGAGADARHLDVRLAGCRILEVFNHAVGLAEDVAHLREATAVEEIRTIRGREFVDQRRPDPVIDCDVLERVARRRNLIVGEIHSRREPIALTAGTGVVHLDEHRIAHRAVGPNQRFVVPAGVLAVREVQDVVAIAADVVRRSETRHDAAGVDARDVARVGEGIHLLVPRAEIERPAVVGHPVVLHEEGMIVRCSSSRRASRASSRHTIRPPRIPESDGRWNRAQACRRRRSGSPR